MLIRIARKPARYALGVVILLVAIFYASVAGKLWRADALSRSPAYADWQRAAQLEPRNAEYWHHLGLFEEWDAQRGNLAQAETDLMRAVKVDPWSDTDWLDLAGIEETLGKKDAAQEAYERAQFARPDSPVVAWQFGGFLLRSGEVAAASAQFRRTLEQDSSRIDDVVALCQRAGVPIADVLDNILPASSRYYEEAEDYFVSKNNSAEALAVWQRWYALREKFEMASALPLVNELIGEDKAAEAQDVWQQALEKSQWPQGKTKGGSLVFNGGFEEEPLDGGFDWRMVQSPHVTFERDDTVKHSGAYSLRIALDHTTNLDFQNLVQFVAVEPGRRYHFSAFVRTDEITTDSGFGFLLVDPFHPKAPESQTTALIGTNGWTAEEADFAAGPETKFLEIVVWRKPSEKFDNKIGGTVWVDDVALTPIGAAAGAGKP